MTNPKWRPINNPKDVVFKGKSIYIKHNPRTGVCSLCCRKIGDRYNDKRGKPKIIKRTHMHHDEYYEDEPLRATRELCQSCHNHENWIQKNIFNP